MIKIITFLGKSISHFLCKKKVIAEQEVEVYQYGFEILISTTLGLLITVAIGIVLNMFFLSVLYYVIFVMVRQWTGGYHADSYLKCNITFAGITFFTLGMTKLSDMSEMYSLTIHGLMLVFALLSVWKYTPVENPNKRIREEMKEQNKIMSFAMLVVWYLVCSVFVFAGTYEISTQIWATIDIIALLLCVKRRKRK